MLIRVQELRHETFYASRTVSYCWQLDDNAFLQDNLNADLEFYHQPQLHSERILHRRKLSPNFAS